MIGLIFSVSIGLIVHAVFPNIRFDQLIFDFAGFNYKSLIILGIVVITGVFYKKLSPIKIILLSSVLGMIIYSILP